MRRILRLYTAAAIVIAALVPVILPAQEATTEDPAAAPATPATPAPATPAAPADAEEPAASEAKSPGDKFVVREKTIYVPYEELTKVFEKEGRGIFLPYEEFLKLWRAAQKDPPGEEPEGPPTDVVIRSGVYTGTVSKDIARFEVTYTVEALNDGWSDVALPLGYVAIESIDVGTSDAVFVADPKGYRLILHDRGKYTVKLVFSVRVASSPGRKTLSFAIPPLAVSQLDLTIPEAGARVDVEPLIAATKTEPGDGVTKLLAFVGNSSQLKVHWMPPAGKATEDAAVVIAEQSARAYLGERNLQLDSAIHFSLARGETAELKVRVPTADNTRLVSVKGKNIRQWDLEGDQLTVQLHSPVDSSYQLSLTFQRILAETPDSISIPLPRMEGVLRESGWLALAHDSTLDTHVVSANGTSQLDPDEVPQALRAGMRVAFRYLAPPEPLTLAVTTITPVVRSNTTSVVSLGRERDIWVGFVDYMITKAGLFHLAIKVPERWSVEEIGDPSIVDGYQVSDPAGGLRTITVNLKSRQLGKFRLPFRLTTTDGTGTQGETTLEPPIVVDSEQDRGLLGVAPPR